MNALVNNLLRSTAAARCAAAGLISCASEQECYPTPVILNSDLYYPGQDVGDNFDVVTPFALDRINLRGIIFDITQRFRREADVRAAAREPGFIPVTQLNFAFGRNVPCACSPFTPMRSPDDRMEDLPNFQQTGFELFFRLLCESERPVEVISTGSCRLLAAAYNRNPELMRRKIAAIHLSAGASSDTFREWNIDLDTLAAYRLLTSDLRINLYPCATADGPFDKGENNTFWSLDKLDFVLEMEPMLRNYIVFAFLHKNRTDYLSYMENPLPSEDEAAFRNYRIDRWFGSGGCHYIWETSLWQQAAGLALVQQAGEAWRLIPREQAAPNDRIFDEGLRPVTVTATPDGLFRFAPTDEPSNFNIYYRSSPELHQQALREALPALYKSYRIEH